MGNAVNAVCVLLAVSCGAGFVFLKGSAGTPTAPVEEPVASPPATDLLTARQGFRTNLFPPPFLDLSPPVSPPSESGLELVRYKSLAGALRAYLSVGASDGRKRPAILWAHPGTDGIGPPDWGAAASLRESLRESLRDAQCGIMMPSWRGENDNPGQRELFYGEVDDLLAARDALARQPHVDPDRIYLIGQQEGGTLVLLAATATDRFRAAFVIGGTPNLAENRALGNTPFDPTDANELRLRSAVHFLGAIKRPTFVFGTEPIGAGNEQIRPFPGPADPAAILRLLAEKIRTDTGPTCSIAIDPAELMGK